MTERILVVDDEPDVRALLSTMLGHEGWTVSTAVDGESALRAYEEGRPHLLVLDNMMPGITGIEVAQELRRKGSSVPIVLFSGYLNPELIDQAQKLGVWTCSKVDLRALVRVIRNLIESAQRESEDDHSSE